jgi:23S rRNA (guanine745-N1)-methyltransferase
MLADVLPLLACPHCGDPLTLVDRIVTCPRRHAFDVAREGYVSLRPGGAPTDAGDTAEMVAARAAFLAAGHYAPIARALAEEAAQIAAVGPAGAVVEIGAGTGYYLANVLERLPARLGLALDASRPALRRAARAHPRLGAVGCDARFPLPVRSAAAALVLDVFAPRPATELRRILRDDGALVVVTPTARHLEELVGALGLLDVDPQKAERLALQLGPLFTPARETACSVSMALGHDAVEALVGMGPSAWHTDPAALRARVRALPAPVAVTAAVTISVYRPR